jgi:recombinational DNA repair protein RecT
MAKKTAIKQLIRFLPLSTEMRPLATAAHLDGTVREEHAPVAVDDAAPTWVDATQDLADEVQDAADADAEADFQQAMETG